MIAAGYMALLGRSRWVGNNIISSLVWRYLSGREGEPVNKWEQSHTRDKQQPRLRMPRASPPVWCIQTMVKQDSRNTGPSTTSSSLLVGCVAQDEELARYVWLGTQHVRRVRCAPSSWSGAKSWIYINKYRRKGNCVNKVLQSYKCCKAL